MKLVIGSNEAVIAMVASANDLAGKFVRLFVNDAVLTPDMVDATFTEPTFTGYAAQAIGARLGLFRNAQGDFEAIYPAVTFTKTDNVLPGDSIRGAWVRFDGAGTAIKLGVKFTTPYQLVANGDILVLVPKLTLAFTGFGGVWEPE